MTNKKLIPPTESIGDYAHTAAKTAISLVPYGGPAAELFAAIVTAPLEKRRHEWMNDVAEGLEECRKRNKLGIDDLGKPEFLDAMLQASQAAIKTSQTEKREALKNAVLNSAIPNSLDESKRAMFISFVDTLTVWHLRLLSWFTNPPRWYQTHNRQPREIYHVGNLTQILGEAFPELRSDKEIVELCVSDLQNRGLLSKFGFNTNMGSDGIYAARGTRLGIEFLNFISAPTEN